MELLINKYSLYMEYSTSQHYIPSPLLREVQKENWEARNGLVGNSGYEDKFLMDALDYPRSRIYYGKALSESLAAASSLGTLRS